MEQANKFDLTDRRFGKLTALRVIEGKNSKAKWECRCDCGTVKAVSYHSLTVSGVTSCGCARGGAGKDLTNQRFGRLIALERTNEKKGSCWAWRCRCDCGNETLVASQSLTSGNTRSCGCATAQARKARFRDLTNQRFGRLIAQMPLDDRVKGSVVWQCMCDCGRVCEYPASELVSGAARSCGCLKYENDVLQQKLHYIDGTCVEFIENTGAVSRRNTTGYRGLKPVRGRWEARITFKKKTYFLGSFADKDDAIRARQRAEEEVYGEFLDWYHREFPEKRKGEI